MSDDKEPTKPNIRIVGSVSGGNVNVGGEQTFSGDVSINMGGDSLKNAEFAKLMAQLNEILAQAKVQNPKEAAELSRRLEDVVSEAKQETPDKESVEFKANKFKQAAEVLGAVMPSVLPIATQIVAHILNLGH